MACPSLLTAQNCEGQIHLIVGNGALAASRCQKSLQVGARPILAASNDIELHFSLAKLVEQDVVGWTKQEYQDSHLTSLGREEVDHVVDAVFVTTAPSDPLSIHISSTCRRLRIPVNVVDAPKLCTFTLLSTHSDGPLQIGITTSGRGCKLSSRIRREIAASLPSHIGDAIERLGTMRKRIWEEDNRRAERRESVSFEQQPELENEDEEAANQKHTFNTLVQPSDTDPVVVRTRRMRWLSQICEYWPLQRLANITDADVDNILTAYQNTSPSPTPSLSTTPPQRMGTITLAGSGPGHASLLTLATHTAIQTAHFILADKLVPSTILSLIPRRTPVYIARKFPGNAEAAQEELQNMALAALQEGKDVLRLKQGDPYLYGRGAEEVIWFRKHGYEARVIPGVTSSLSAPLFAGVPVTHRGFADQVVVCTGTGRKGASPEPPSYSPMQTVVFLMALHRLESLVDSLVHPPQTATITSKDTPNTTTKPTRTAYPLSTPCAVIERASCPDQRVIRSTLAHVVQAVEELGSRPPGLLVVGRACEVLTQIGTERWIVEEGFRGLDNIGHAAEELSGKSWDLLRAVEAQAGKGGMEESAGSVEGLNLVKGPQELREKNVVSQQQQQEIRIPAFQAGASTAQEIAV